MIVQQKGWTVKTGCVMLVLCLEAVFQASADDRAPLVERGVFATAGSPAARIVIAETAQPVAEYAAEELALHVELSTGVRLPILREPVPSADGAHSVYLGETRAALEAGLDVESLPSEAFTLRTLEGDVFIAAKEGPGDPLSTANTFSGVLWGVYEVLERDLGVRWLWPGPLGTHVPRKRTVRVGPFNETIGPRFIHRMLRPGVSEAAPALADLRLAFTPEDRAAYVRAQSVFLRRHRMGSSAGTYFSERTSGSGHSFEGWWERYGGEHPEWFEMSAEGRRGPADPLSPQKVSMCVSNPELQRKIVDLWREECARHPGERVNLGVGENDRAGACRCPECLAWDGPAPSLEGLPPGLERSYEPTQASNRYARFLQAVHALASASVPDVKLHFYAFENYFWAPSPDIRLDKNIVIGFVPWFRWAGWFPRTDAEQEWIKQQWLGWQRTGATVYYRPNWFLDGWTMPHIYPHQFADAFTFYAGHGMVGADFDTLLGQWGAQGPNLYLLARIHVRPEAPVDRTLDEYYAAFGPAKRQVEKYFRYWEDYSIRNRENAADSIRKRGGRFRRYAKYAAVADELYPPEVFPPAQRLLDRARKAAQGAGSPYTERVMFLQAGLDHARKCVETASVMNNARATAAEREAALANLAAFRRGIAPLLVSNLDRMAVIETESWELVPTAAQP